MKFLGYEILSPEDNMKKDEELLFKLESEEIEPCFRIYEWSEICVSLGLNQEVRNFPVKVVRRPTGGGALLHGWDLSFCVVDYKEKWGKTTLRIYKRLSSLFLEVFKNLGVEILTEKSKGYQLENYFCYFFPNFGEIRTKDGRKVVAIAMRTLKNTFLAHGSIYVYFDYAKASEILGIDRDILKSKVISLKELGIKKENFISEFLDKINK